MADSAKSLLTKVSHALKLDQLPAVVRRVIVGTIGGTILLIGIALIFLPGPAFIVIPIGLAILATEFAWARHSLQKARGLFRKKEKSE
jgi:uncharacterized protein (TIGR02611 family)